MTHTSQSRVVYVFHIATTPEKLWNALTQPEFTRRYWCETWQVSQWTPGSDWRAMIPDGRIADSGRIILADKPRKLVLTWENQFLTDLQAEGHSTLTYEREQMSSSVKLTLTHEMERPKSKLIDAVSQGWPSLMSSLKSLLETGQPLAETSKWPEGM
jgi:uncharacterized protein YndB with AHSA1/START domain